MIWWGKQITPAQLAIPKYKFAIMGTLDGIAGEKKKSSVLVLFVVADALKIIIITNLVQASCKCLL